MHHLHRSKLYLAVTKKSGGSVLRTRHTNGKQLLIIEEVALVALCVQVEALLRRPRSELYILI
jgi:hypothetical protein